MTALAPQRYEMPRPVEQPAFRNHLLRRMTAEDFALLEPHLEPCVLERRDVLEDANEPIAFVYFFERGIGSVVASTAAAHETEVGLIGCEGMTGSAIVMGDD